MILNTVHFIDKLLRIETIYLEQCNLNLSNYGFIHLFHVRYQSYYSFLYLKKFSIEISEVNGSSDPSLFSVNEEFVQSRVAICLNRFDHQIIVLNSSPFPIWSEQISVDQNSRSIKKGVIYMKYITNS